MEIINIIAFKRIGNFPNPFVKLRGEIVVYIENFSSDPYFNLAMEEYVLKHLNSLEKIFFLWQDDPTIVVGRNQNTIEEINQEFIKAKGINVVRRMTGGGAVYHDLGNLNFTFIVSDEDNTGFDFEKFTRPVIKSLARIGIKAENNGRNDITIEGKKFSGNAQCRYKNRVLHHGTLLFNSSQEDMVAALNVSEDKFISKGIKSVRSRVTNIAEHLQKDMSIKEFRDLLKHDFWNEDGSENFEYQLSEMDLEKINELRKHKYKTWEWVYGHSPAFNVKNAKRFDWGKIEVRLDVKRGIIEKCKFYGDFFNEGDIDELASKLIGLSFQEKVVKDALKEFNLSDYLSNCKDNEFIKLLMG